MGNILLINCGKHQKKIILLREIKILRFLYLMHFLMFNIFDVPTKTIITFSIVSLIRTSFFNNRTTYQKGTYLWLKRLNSIFPLEKNQRVK